MYTWQNEAKIINVFKCRAISVDFSATCAVWPYNRRSAKTLEVDALKLKVGSFEKFGWTRTGRRLTRIFMLGALTIWSPSEAAACGYHDDVSIAAAIYAELVRILRHLANPTLSVANTSHRTKTS